jgi:hypothetical protein
LLFLSTQPLSAEEFPEFEKIRNISPDGKFELRIRCSSEPADSNSAGPELITATDLASLPSKKVMAQLLSVLGRMKVSSASYPMDLTLINPKFHPIWAELTYS